MSDYVTLAMQELMRENELLLQAETSLQEAIALKERVTALVDTVKEINATFQ